MPKMTFDTCFELTDLGRASVGQPTETDLCEPDADYCGDCGERYEVCACDEQPEPGFEN
jgi:hypothetical protein